MIQNHSDISSQGGHFSHSEIRRSNDSELYRLIQNATKLTNTAEEKVNYVDVEAGGITKTGLLKYLLLGGVILTGVGALAVGGYYYIAGRASPAGRTEDLSPANDIGSRIANNTAWDLDSYPSKMSSNTLISIMSSQSGAQTTSSPYHYYESIYSSTTALNDDSTSTPVTTTPKAVTTTESPAITTTRPVTVTTGSFNSVYMTAKPTTTISNPGGADAEIKDSKYMRGRDVFFQETQTKDGYPFGEKFYNEIASFCFKEIKPFIEQALMTDSRKSQCDRLDNVMNEIGIIKYDLAPQTELISNEEYLLGNSPDERAILKKYFHDKRIAKSKLSALHLASEYIIKKKEFGLFVIEASGDDNEYTANELAQREKNIFDYISNNC